MVFENHDENWKKIILECDCGCSSIEIMQDTDDFKTVYINFKKDMHWGAQESFIYRAKEWFKMAWTLLRGRSYIFFDIVLMEQSVSDLKKVIAELELPKER